MSVRTRKTVNLVLLVVHLPPEMCRCIYRLLKRFDVATSAPGGGGIGELAGSVGRDDRWVGTVIRGSSAEA